jgi:Flp pilus assembly protein TadB
MIIMMICITIIAIALAGYFARRAKLMEKRKIRASLKSAETEIALRRSLKNLGKEYEKMKAHSMARCSKCGRICRAGQNPAGQEAEAKDSDRGQEAGP